MPDTLPVFLYGEHIADLSRETHGLALHWSGSTSLLRGSTDLSANLPTGIRAASDAVENYFGGLLPEGPWLNKLANEVGTHHTDIYGLLHHVGADLAGALSIGEPRTHREPQKLNPQQLPQLLEEASSYFTGGGGSALPGYQRKITLTRIDNEWWLGNGSIPSTHILKPTPTLNTRITDAENYLLGLSRQLGLTTFDSWTERIGDLNVVVIERYDRTTEPGTPTQRIHQEDAAQALGLPWLTDAKFQRTDPRANLTAIAGLLDRDRTIFDTTEPDRTRLLKYVTFNLATGNTDAHAKNYSILRPQNAPARLAPLYDLMPLAVLADARLGLPLYINGKTMSNETTLDDLIAEAEHWGVPRGDAVQAATSTLDQLIDATRTTPAPDTIAQLVPGFVRELAQALLDGDPARIDGAVPAYYRSQIGTPGPTEGH